MIVGIALVLVGVLASGGGLGPAPSARVEDERAVERARYRFVIGATKPFDEVYPRSVFEKRVAREAAQERVLKRVFGLSVTRKLLADEFDRIEKTTKAPEQWEAIKKALGSDRGRIGDAFCRPLVVERALRAKFAFDQKIHAGPHQEAREARASFLAGKTPPGAVILVLRRHGEAAPSTEEMLGQARAQASVPRELSPAREPAKGEPVSPDPEMARVLEKELAKPGDVTTILEERDRFSVFRLIAVTDDSWNVDAVHVSKADFDAWFEKVRHSL